MTTISNTFANILANTNGRFFNVKFIKKDGSLRSMTARLNVTKALKGGVCTVDKSAYLIAYDVRAKGYRSINVDTIVSITCNGETAVRLSNNA